MKSKTIQVNLEYLPPPKRLKTEADFGVEHHVLIRGKNYRGINVYSMEREKVYLYSHSVITFSTAFDVKGSPRR